MIYRNCFVIVLFLICFFFLSGCVSVKKENPVQYEETADDSEKIHKNTGIINNSENSDQSNTGNESNINDNEENKSDLFENEEKIQNTDYTSSSLSHPLSINVVLDRIINLIEFPEQPVKNNNTILYLVHDFNADGVDEVCVLGIESENKDDARIKYLSDFSRLFTPQKKIFPFFLNIYSNNQGVVQKLVRLELGQHAVFESINQFSLNKGKLDPYVISINFYTKEGTIQNWLIFKHPRVSPISQLLLPDTYASKAIVEDINSDGFIDIILFERGMEEGIGCETFITWKKWDGRKFIDYKTTNIVRNLNNFLYTIRELSLSGKLSDLIFFSFDPDARKEFEKMGYSQQELLIHFLGLTKYHNSGGEQDEFVDFNPLENINDIIFPEILDNPFFIRDEKGFYVKLSFRIIYSDGVSLIPKVLIYMLKNPFGVHQFVLCPVPVDTEESSN